MNANIEILRQINQADDLKIAPFHADGKSTGTPTWIWEVLVDDRLFVRAYSGQQSSWYQAALKQKAGEIHALGQRFTVRFAPINDSGLNDRIDQAYRQKYASSRYMQYMISAAPRAATVEVLLD